MGVVRGIALRWRTPTTWDRARRPQRCRLAQRPVLCAHVAEKLAADWSPQQIAGWLKRTYPQDPDMQVSHETIYLSLFVQSRGVLKKELLRHLRRRKTMRRSQHASDGQQPRGQIVDAMSIRERPASIEDRAVPGHWEGDLLAGKSNSHIATLVERQSRFVMLVRLPGKDTQSVVRALTRRVRTLPDRSDVVTHLGSRDGAGRAQVLFRGHGRPGVFLRSAQSLAARLEREHERSAAPVLSRTAPTSRPTPRPISMRSRAV